AMLVCKASSSRAVSAGVSTRGGTWGAAAPLVAVTATAKSEVLWGAFISFSNLRRPRHRFQSGVRIPGGGTDDPPASSFRPPHSAIRPVQCRLTARRAGTMAEHEGDPRSTGTPPGWVAKRDGRLEPFDGDKIC